MVKSNLLSLCRRLLLPKRGFKWLMEQVNLPFPGVTFLPSENGRRFPWVNIFFDSLHLRGQHCWNTLSWASTHPPQHFRLTVSLPRHSVKKVPSFCLKPLSLGGSCFISMSMHGGEVERFVDWKLIHSWCYLVDATSPTVFGEMLRRYQFSWWCFHIEPRTKKRSRWCTNLTSPLAEKVVSS